MSVFAQYVPFDLAAGTWDERRQEIGDLAVSAISRFAPDVAEVIVHREVLGPPDVEARIGLTGGHIFQGECLPDQMWADRFGPRTPIPGVYLCGASTHPGGSVMAVNGRNAAMAVERDLARRHRDHPGGFGPDGSRAPAPPIRPARRRLPTAALVVVYLCALGTFIGIVALRGGPSVGDAYGVTKPATALADGDLHGAAKDSVLPQPPGYALLASPFVLAFRPLIGSPTWCDGRVAAGDAAVVALVRARPALHPPVVPVPGRARTVGLAGARLRLRVAPPGIGGGRGVGRSAPGDRAGRHPRRRRQHRRDVSSPGPRERRARVRGTGPGAAPTMGRHRGALRHRLSLQAVRPAPFGGGAGGGARGGPSGPGSPCPPWPSWDAGSSPSWRSTRRGPGAP